MRKKSSHSLLRGNPFIWVTVISQLLVASNVPAETCIELGDPAGNIFPQGFCTPTDPGKIDGEVDITLDGLEFRVPDDGRLDVIVPLTKGFAAPPAVNYSSSLTWTTPMETSSLRVRDRGVAFHLNPAQVVAPITDTNDPAQTTAFSWILNPDGKAIGWEVKDRLLNDIAPQNAVDHLHMTMEGVPAREIVRYSTSVTGGTIVLVPEPSSGMLGILGLATIAALRRRRR